MSREQGLAQAFVELADTRNDQSDELHFVAALARHCVDLVGWSAIVVLLADQDDVLQLAAMRPEGNGLSELLERPNDENLYTRSYHQQLPVRLDLTVPASTLTPFARTVADAGFAAVHAFPLSWRGEAIGSYALFAKSPVDGTAEDLELAQALAEAATITILHKRELVRAESLAQQLQGALNSRVVIEQAKGVVAEHAGLDMEGAFDVLRTYARKNRMRLALLARNVVRGVTQPDLLLSGWAGTQLNSVGRARPTRSPSASGPGRDKRR